MLVFAYDGSLNGDWVAHYAVRFAANAPERRLRLVHVHETPPVSHLEERIARIADECAVLDVQLETERVAPATDVAARLLECVPQGATLIAGTRARQRHSMFLAGTVAARLLEAGRFPVIAIRVVHPGVLGQPGSVLLPLAARASSAAHALFLLRLLGGDLQHLHVLFVRELPRLRLRILGGEYARRRLAEGRAFVAPVEEALRTGLAPHRFELDSSVAASDDPSREVLLYAARYRSRLICLDASDRTWPSRLFHGDPIERVLRDAPSDVAVYRSLD
jgi:nucleotide-binding universal stress UspA family protein